MSTQNTGSSAQPAGSEPFIPATQSLPEITLKGTILAVFLTIILTAANAFLGLKVGLTISASIPAAVFSMGALRFFKNSNILENNIVQTAASTGEAVTSGIIFIIPALIILKYWTDFNYIETAAIGVVGSILGVIFSIPLRRVLLADPNLKFPEGVAIGSVLKASESSGSEIKYLVFGGLFGGLIEFAQDGLRVLANSLEYWTIQGGKVFGLGVGLSPALIAAGYIIGVNVSIAIFVGIVLGWLCGVPIISCLHGFDSVSTGAAIAHDVWSNNIRYVGVGAMTIGGVWTLINLAKPVYLGLKASIYSVSHLEGKGVACIPRTKRDIPIRHAFWVLAFMMILVFFLIMYFTSASLGDGNNLRYVIAFIGALYVLFVGFILASLSGYFAGLIGATNNPASGMLIAGILVLCLLLMVVFELMPGYAGAMTSLNKAVIAILIISIIGSAITMANDTIQDLKAGQMVGATPWKQQAMLVFGGLIGALMLPFILQLLFHAYGIGGVFPRAGMDHSQMLAAPQAGLMAAIAQGVFEGDLPWAMIGVGGIIAVFSIVVDEIAKRRHSRFPVLAVGIGIYLPLAASVPLVIGGVLSYICRRKSAQMKREKIVSEAQTANNQHNALLQACGLVAGASIMGVILAIPFAITRNSNALRIVSESFTPIASALGVISIIGLGVWMYRVATSSK